MCDIEQKIQNLKIDRTQKTSGQRSPKLWLLGISMMICAGIFAVYWFFIKDQSIPSVDVATVIETRGQTPLSTVLDATGYVVARRQTTVSSKTTGKVMEVLIEEGMVVEENQLLATLDDSLQRAQLALAVAQLEESLASQGELEIQIRQAKLDLERMQLLNLEAMVSENEVDQAELELDLLQLQLQRLHKSINVANSSVELQNMYLDDLKIRAPFGGIVTAKAAQPGEMISPVSGGGFTRTGICTIVDMDSIEVQVDVNEKFINRVVPKQPVTVTLNSYPDTQLKAEVIAIIPTADRARATVRVRIGFLEKDSRILPDMGVSVSFYEEEMRMDSTEFEDKVSLTVPVSAILEGVDSAYVWIVSEEAVFRRDVEVSPTEGSRVEVLAGLAQGDVVVVNLTPELGVRLEDGLPISIN